MPTINFEPKTRAWIQLIAEILGTFAAVAGTAIAGGCKPWVAGLTGLGAAGMAVRQALADSPNDAQPKS